MTKLMMTTHKDELGAYIPYGEVSLTKEIFNKTTGLVETKTTKLVLNEGTTNYPEGKDLSETFTGSRAGEVIPSDMLGHIIGYECERASRSHQDQSELESYLLEKVWIESSTNESYQTLKGVRELIKSRRMDFLRKDQRNSRPIVDEVKAVRRLNKKINDIVKALKTSSDIEQLNEQLQKYMNELALSKQSLENAVRTRNSSNDFDNVEIEQALEIMSERQRKVAELQVGIFDSLDIDQLNMVREMLVHKAMCRCHQTDCSCTFEVYLTLEDIGQVLDVSVRTIKNEVKALKQVRD